MTDEQPLPPQPNSLGKASLLLGIVASVFVFFIGVCAGVGQQQGWLKNVSTLLFILGSTAAFMGLLAGLLGFSGLFGRNRSKATAIVGLILGVGTLLLFAAIVQNAQ